MRQMIFSDLGFEVHSKQTRRQRFLSEMDAIVPWLVQLNLVLPCIQFL